MTPGEAVIKPGRNRTCTLEVGEDDGKHTYQGVQRPNGPSNIALFWNPTEKTFFIDKIDTDLIFNLVQTSNATRLGTTDPEAADHFDEDDDEDNLPADDAAPDPSNPYDYRHFLNEAEFPRSPITNQHLNVSSPPKPASATPKPQEQHLSPLPTKEPELDNSNDLVIDMGDEAPSKTRPWRYALGILNEGGRNGGPISLRSAASSMSPSIRGGSDGEDEGEDEDEEQEESEEDTGNGWDDMGEELEAELEQALEKIDDHEQAGEVQSSGIVNDSSSESEEE